MRKLSTRCMENIDSKGMNAHDVKTSPKEQTLDFLRQFARVYNAESNLYKDIRGYVLN